MQMQITHHLMVVGHSDSLIQMKQESSADCMMMRSSFEFVAQRSAHD